MFLLIHQTWYQSINRNILECKGLCWISDLIFTVCINRNILECKGSSLPGKSNRLLCINRNILECKEGIFVPSGRSFRCINRNILECKDHRELRECQGSGVLIETYWNVKWGMTETPESSERVLIETYWNVKIILHSADAFTFQYVSINTDSHWKKSSESFPFTFQYVSINT